MKLWFLVAFFLVVYDICFAAKPVPLPFLPREAPLPLQSKSRASTFQQQSFPAISRQSVSGDGYGGTGFTVMPVLRNEEPATAILIHGLGGTGEELGFVSLALSFFSLNYVKFILPTAPTRPVTYLGNKELPSWYDIFIIRDFGASVNRTELLESVARVDRIIEGEIKAGVPQNRIFVLGFSQGGGVALTTFLRSSFNLAGCIGVATWLPLAVDYPELLSPTASNKQILLLHGTEDTAVPLSYAVLTANRINNFGQPFNLTANLTRLVGEGHLLVTPYVLTAIEEYISSRATGTTRFLVRLVNDLTKTFAALNKRMESNPLSKSHSRKLQF